ncbi:sodium-dependent transporter [Streptomyces sp. NPDC058686]|uniref:sodium-dependent transporter n=1 Tax=Streptomyces sp. NPDC058686 TaxID=3346599 RepID=UPI00365535F7
MSPATVSCATRFAVWLRSRLGRAVLASYAAALLMPWPGLWLRRPHSLGSGGIGMHLPPVLLGVLLFAAGFQIRLHALTGLVRRPLALLAALVLHLTVPLVLVPVLVALLRQTPDSDHGSGIVTAMVLIVTMPVAANATVWTAKGAGDQPTIVAAVLGSTLVSPLTTPLVISSLATLLHGPYAHTLSAAAQLTHGGFALSGIVLPCVAGVLCRIVTPAACLGFLESGVTACALLASLATTYVNASGALAPCLAHPRPLLVGAAVTAAAGMCGASFLLGHAAGTTLRLDRGTRSSLALACGMSNSSAGAVMITASMPDKPHLLLPVLAYGLVQKGLAGLVVRQALPAPSPS